MKLFLLLSIIVFLIKESVCFPFTVIAQGGKVNEKGGYCVGVQGQDDKGNYGYDKTNCMLSKQFGTCLNWSDIIKNSKQCNSDGIFCWDFDNSGQLYVWYANNKFWVGDFSGLHEHYKCTMQCDTTWSACKTTSCTNTGYKCG